MKVEMIHAPSGPQFLVTVSPRFTGLMKQIPGARYSRGEDAWVMAATRAQAAALGGILGKGRLEYGPGVKVHLQYLKGVAIQQERNKEYERDTWPELYSFQNKGTAFLLSAGSALLADEMGLGKTVQALTALDTPALIVCTNSMKFTWAEEAERWRPTASVAVVDGNVTKRRKQFAEQADITIINYDALRLHSSLAGFGSVRAEGEDGELNERVYATVVADEVHKIKNPKAKMTRALWKIGGKAMRRIGLSGTPIVNDPDDLWSVMHFVAPLEWPARARFRDRYCITKVGWHGGMENLGLNPLTEPELRTFLEPRYLRRTKGVVGLRSWEPEVRRLPLTNKQEKAYNQMVKHMMTELDSGLLLAADPIVALGRLRYIASAVPLVDEEGNVTELSTPSNKVQALLDIVEEGYDQKLVVYAESRKLIELADRELQEAGYSTGLITGKVSPEMRALNVKEFQEGDIQVMLGTTGAGAEGITLTAASRMVFLQEAWSNVANRQSKGRINRIGQEASELQYITLLSQGTVDEAVHATCHEKESKLQQLVRDPDWIKGAMKGEV